MGTAPARMLVAHVRGTLTEEVVIFVSQLFSVTIANSNARRIFATKAYVQWRMTRSFANVLTASILPQTVQTVNLIFTR